MDDVPLYEQRRDLLLNYCHQFVEMANNLSELRKDKLDKAPGDDPMQYDESQFRAVEALVLSDLMSRVAEDSDEGIRAILTVHATELRRCEVPVPEFDADTGMMNRNNYRYHLLDVVTEMRTTYERACEDLNIAPSTAPMARIQELITTIEDALGEMEDPARVVRGLSFVRLKDAGSAAGRSGVLASNEL